MNRAKRISLSFASLAAAMMIGGAAAAPPLGSKWQGLLQSAAGPMQPQISVALTIHSAKFSVLQFSAPWSCRLVLEYLDDSRGNSVYKVERRDSGIACDRQHGGRATLSSGADGKVILNVTGQGGTYHAQMVPAPN